MAGARKIGRETWKEMKSMNVIGLVESWEVGKEKWEEEFGNFEWKSIEATKEHKKGRAKGGMVLAVKESKDRIPEEWKEGISKPIYKKGRRMMKGIIEG